MRERALLRSVISDTDILCAVETHMPQIRGLHGAVTPVIDIVLGWDNHQLYKLDRKLGEGCKDSAKMVRNAVQRACMARVKAEKIDTYAIPDSIDPATILTAAWGVHVFEQAVDEFSKSYEMIYQALAHRISIKKMYRTELDHLHAAFAEFMLTSSEMSMQLGTLDKHIESMTQSKAVLQDTVNTLAVVKKVIQAVRDAFTRLKEVHHLGYQVMKTR